MRDRAGVILVENNHVALIKRIRNDSVYYVFPGGGIDEGEDPKTAAKREAFEELGVTVNISECVSKVEFNGTQYFFLAEIFDGTFGTGQGEEYTGVNSDRGTYLPTWIDIENLSNLDVKPREVAIKVQSIFNNSTDYFFRE
ncbi:NUDIX domain-containing protein [Paenisporosarcina quisquiliarum]|uniref:NUDIX domain-containing protein n=1 Tax=Paenisporosarcina quisquiliarum TaxID=365346 RepID=A0A9X3RD15_9BACL|nr:NUDIX domain-containing protein [Paenisporosarcina quisquiliarum]MCZ8537076.1 NUDIX domain-containing protein [Paenisporosarcina quisquiliarum]